MPDLIDRWLTTRQLSDRPLAVKTFKSYSVVANRLKIAFAEFKPADVKPSHLYQYLTAKSVTTAMASHYRSVMMGAMQLAVEEGMIDANPIKEVKHFTSKTRDRYLSDGEYSAIRNKATPTLQSIMDITYLTGQRIGDVLCIRLSDLGREGITFTQQKTGTRLCVAWSPDLEESVKTAKRLHTSLKGFHLFHTRKGKPFSYWTIRTLWNRAAAAAGIEDAHLHDLRAKAATDMKKTGGDSKALLGHKSEQVHLRYLRDKETPIVQPVKKRVG